MKKIWIITLATLSMLFWASSFVWFKIVFKYYKPISVTILRLSISFILLSIYALLTKKWQKIEKSDFKIIALLAFFEPFCYFLGESYGMQYVSASLGSIIISTIPLVTPIFAFLFLKERLSIYGILGLLLSFAGVALIVVKDFDSSFSWRGIALMFFAVLSGTSYGILLKKVAFKYSSITIVKWQNILGFIYFMPIFFTTEWSHFITVKPNFEAIYTIIKLSFFCSTMAFILFTQVVKQIGVSLSNIFTNLIPVFTTIIAYFILKEEITTIKIIGIIIVISGLFLAQFGEIVNHIKKKFIPYYQGLIS